MKYVLLDGNLSYSMIDFKVFLWRYLSLAIDYVRRLCLYMLVLFFGLDIVKFLHNILYGAMFWFRAANTVDKTPMFSLLLSSVYTTSKPFLILTLPH